MAKSYVITHRGLEPSKPNFYPESSFEAFQDQLNRGFGIEFDPNFIKGGIVISHNPTLLLPSEGKDKTTFGNLSIAELSKVKLWNNKHTSDGRIPTFDELMELIRGSSSGINALHFKGKFQESDKTTLLIGHLQRNSDILPKLLVFDVKPKTAGVLLAAFPTLQLAPSVAHQYDTQRYNSFIENTLIDIDEVERLLKDGVFGKYPWVWLDEWDLTDQNNGQKKLYTKEVFDRMRKAGARIALVTPELHGTSPGLYGRESHPDSKDKNTLFARIKNIIALKPDAICTDYPEEIAKLI